MKMKIKIFLFNVLIIIFALSSCTKDSDIFTPNATSPSLDTNWVSVVTDASLVSQLKRTLNKDAVLDSLDASLGGSFRTSEGLMVFVLPQSLLLPNGQVATGKIYAETMLVKERGEMVKLDKPTTSFGRILNSGGQVFIKLRKESEELHLASGKTIYIKYQDNNYSSVMKVFHGDESNLFRFNWDISSDGINTSSQQGYEISSSVLRWISPNYFADTSGTKVNISGSLPADCTNGNTVVFLVFKDFKSVVAMYGDVNTKKFTAFRIPTGRQAVVISITKKGTNSFYLGHESLTTGQSGTISGGQIIPLSPKPTSITEIKNYLSTL